MPKYTGKSIVEEVSLKLNPSSLCSLDLVSKIPHDVA